MPRLSCWFIRLALIHLVLGFTLGALMLAQKAGALGTAVWAFRVAHQEFLLAGFMLQLVFGVGFWILPRPVHPQHGWPMVAALILINAGVWLAAAGGTVPAWGGVAILGRLSEVGAVGLFASTIWPRVRPFQHARG